MLVKCYGSDERLSCSCCGLNIEIDSTHVLRTVGFAFQTIRDASRNTKFKQHDYADSSFNYVAHFHVIILKIYVI